MIKLYEDLRPSQAQLPSPRVLGDDGSLTIYTKAPAIEGRANLAAVKLLAKHFGVSSSKVKLVRGASSKYKVLEIDKTE